MTLRNSPPAKPQVEIRPANPRRGESLRAVVLGPATDAERAAVVRTDVPGRTRLLADFHIVLARMMGNEVMAQLLGDLFVERAAGERALAVGGFDGGGGRRGHG